MSRRGRRCSTGSFPPASTRCRCKTQDGSKLLQRIVRLRAGYQQRLPIGPNTPNTATLELQLRGFESDRVVVYLHHEQLETAASAESPDPGSRVARFELVPEWDGRFRADFAGRRDVRQTLVFHGPWAPSPACSTRNRTGRCGTTRWL